MNKYQFTMFSPKHKPVACVVEANSRLDFVNKGEPFKKAIEKICVKRLWTSLDLDRFGYKTWKVRKVEENDSEELE